MRARPTASRRRAGELGMTLLETMIALAILSVGFLALLLAMLSSSTLTTSSSEDLEAVLLCENKAAEMKQFGQANFATLWQTYSVPGTAATGTPPTGTPATRNDLVQSASPYNTTNPNGFCWGTATGGIGWHPAPAATNALAKDLQSRLGRDATMTIHFLSENEYMTATGIDVGDPNHQIDLPIAPATRGYYGGSATTVETAVTPTYQYYPVRISVSFTPLSSRAASSLAQGQRTVSVLSLIYPPIKRYN